MQFFKFIVVSILATFAYASGSCPDLGDSCSAVEPCCLGFTCVEASGPDDLIVSMNANLWDAGIDAPSGD
jgi:hypothetical protein